jgi:hypothetical protein
MQNVADIFSIWPTDADLARDIGMSYATVSAWKQRGSIPAAYWRDLIRAARRRGHPEITADLLVDLHAREPTVAISGFGEDETRFEPHADAVHRDAEDEAKPKGTGHFSRFKHLRRSHFASAEEISAHISALRDEWDRR